MALTPEEQAELDELENDTELQTFLSNVSKPKKPKVETGMLEAGLRGAAQGLTFNTADEITAALEGGLGSITGKGFSEPYEKALEESRAEYAASEEQYPKTTLAGQLAGGVAQAVGLGAIAAPAAAGGGAISRLAQVGRNILMPTTKAGLAKNIGTGALAGAAQGGLSSIGGSEKEGLERLEEAPAGVLSGAVLGGGISGVTGVLGAGAKKAGEIVSKGIDEGKYPKIFEVARSAYRGGQRGVGTIASGEKEKVLQSAMDLAENEIKPELQTAVNEARTLKQNILSGMPVSIDLTDSFKTLNTQLKGVGSTAEKALRKDIMNTYNTKIQALNSTGSPMTIADASEIASSITDLLSDATHADVKGKAKELVWNLANSIKSKVRGSVKPEEALRVLSDDPVALKNYSKYVSNLTSGEMLDLFMKGSEAPFNAKEALKKAKDIKDIFKVLTQAFEQEDPDLVSDLIKDPAIRQAIIQSNPIEKLDNVMSKILSSSEILGGVMNAPKYKQADNLDEVVKIFKNILSQAKDSDEAFVNKKRFDAVMTNLQEVVPEVAARIKKKLQPVLEDYQVKTFSEGGGLEQGIKQPGAIKGILGNLAQYGVTGINLASQTAKAVSQGTSGPIPLPFSTLVRPTTSLFQTTKKLVDDILLVKPESTVYKTLSEILGRALEEKDEVRRAAILNTLMQYDSFRKIINPNKEK